MPIYEYKCSLCGKSCELFQKFSDPPETQCPNCNQAGLKKQISAPLFQLKGTGWYVTDFRDKDKPKPQTQAQSSGSETKTGDNKEKTTTETSSSETAKTESSHKKPTDE